MVHLARRFGGLTFAVCVTVALALYCRAMPGSYLSDPWNPYVVVLPFGAVLLCAWATANGSRWTFAAACGIGTLCVQTYVGYAAPVLALLVFAGGAELLRVRRRDGRLHARGVWRALRWALLVLVVMWAPPGYQQLTRDPGNFRSIVHYFTHPDEPAQGLREALKVLAAQFTVRADWITGWRGFNPFSGAPTGIYQHPRPVLAILVLAAMVYAWWRGRRAERTFATVLAIAGAAGTLAASRILGPMSEYRVRWVILFSALAAAFTVALALRLIAAWVRRHALSARALAAVAATVGLLALLAVNVSHATRVAPNNVEASRATHAVMPAVLARYRGSHRPLIMRTWGANADPLWTSIPLELQRAGIPVRWPRGFDNQLRVGSWNVDDGGPVRAVLVAATDEGIDEVATWPHARLVSYDGTLPFRDRAEVSAELGAAVRSSSDPFTLRTLRLKRALAGTAVFELPPTAANRRG
jgi:hypothetical protein